MGKGFAGVLRIVQTCAKATRNRAWTPFRFGCLSSPTPKARGSNPPGRSRQHPFGRCLFLFCMRFYGVLRGGIRTARARRLTSRRAKKPLRGFFRARLGESPPPAAPKMHVLTLCENVHFLYLSWSSFASAVLQPHHLAQLLLSLPLLFVKGVGVDVQRRAGRGTVGQTGGCRRPAANLLRARCPHAWPQKMSIACFTKSAVPAPPARSICRRKRSSPVYICPNPCRISRVQV